MYYSLRKSTKPTFNRHAAIRLLRFKLTGQSYLRIRLKSCYRFQPYSRCNGPLGDTVVRSWSFTSPAATSSGSARSRSRMGVTKVRNAGKTTRPGPRARFDQRCCLVPPTPSSHVASLARVCVSARLLSIIHPTHPSRLPYTLPPLTHSSLPKNGMTQDIISAGDGKSYPKPGDKLTMHYMWVPVPDVISVSG